MKRDQAATGATHQCPRRWVGSLAKAVWYQDPTMGMQIMHSSDEPG